MCHGQLCNVLPCELQNLILKWQIKCGVDDQSSTRQVCTLDIESLCQFVNRVIRKMRREVGVYHSAMQAAPLIGLGKRGSHLLAGDIILEAHLVQHLLHTLVSS